jgi:hypothetical protein
MTELSTKKNEKWLWRGCRIVRKPIFEFGYKKMKETKNRKGLLKLFSFIFKSFPLWWLVRSYYGFTFPVIATFDTSFELVKFFPSGNGSWYMHRHKTKWIWQIKVRECVKILLLSKYKVKNGTKGWLACLIFSFWSNQYIRMESQVKISDKPIFKAYVLTRFKLLECWWRGKSEGVAIWFKILQKFKISIRFTVDWKIKIKY